MKFLQQITLKEYIRLMYVLSYKRRLMVLFTILGLLMLLVTIIYLAGAVPTLFGQDFNPWSDLFMAFIFLVALPASIYFSARSTYLSTKRIQEPIEYELSNETMSISGESFHSVLDWNKTYKIEELKDWFLIYQSKKTANFICKKNLSAEQIQHLQSFFKTLKGVKLKLK